jgi:protein gp37
MSSNTPNGRWERVYSLSDFEFMKQQKWNAKAFPALPLRWTKKTRLASVMWPDKMSFEEWDRRFAAMALTPRHTYQVLTKRPERMAEYLNHPWTTLADGTVGMRDGVNIAAIQIAGRPVFPSQSHGMVPNPGWPLPNVWLGTSVENQAAADERIPHLVRCPAAVRFLSCEPLLGELDVFGPIRDMKLRDVEPDPRGDGRYLHWVIVGGESGPSARPCNIGWIRSIVKQCADAGVPCFVKQLGARPVLDETTNGEDWPVGSRFTTRAGEPQGRSIILRDRKGGDPAEWPEDLRVRQWPVVTTCLPHPKGGKA